MNAAFKQFLFRLSHVTAELNYGRDIVRDWAVDHLAGLPAVPRVLDLGPGLGTDLQNIRAACGRELALFGLESHPPSVEAARRLGITVSNIDIERDRYPFEDASLDLVLANQTLEHTKELFWICSEVSRVLRPGGSFIVGVPNLASLHNRFALLLGMQPFAMEVLGPHVRGFTRGGITEFIECDGYFTLRAMRGSNCYPLPACLSRPLVRVLPGIAVAHFYDIRRTARPGLFVDVLQQRFMETPYFRGAGA